MLDRLRLLPTVILCASLLLVLKLADVATGGESASSLAAISVAHANAPQADEKPAGEAKAETGHEAKTAEEAASADGQPATAEAPAAPVESRLSKSEISVLESLSERRKELDRRADGLDTREQLLAAAEKRVEGRIAELKEIEARINEKIGRQDAENEERLAGLVAMYETMKPKDAARIFERLDMGVLLDVVKRMQPRKMSAVLAAMDPVVAQELTVELAVGDRLNPAPAATPGDEAAPAPEAAVKPAQKAS
ncbi:hypothetical protein [Parvibaculum sp.]|uniref:hypothetical protein n=1 Tax=Parvibaculum sp. TaxID=2024848 RepID=UPI0027321FA8|nr:hypothetical protein [Parvibaculum sp.]MDP1627113.1 hypothetical protein [Parvibaculum sp.]MDP2149296.1 hypothetical protein [Parvibaculum sp.]MDP3329944.1 hypothetical protein [Parvibaculum sp.]